jgi:hypothetical protein
MPDRPLDRGEHVRRRKGIFCAAAFLGTALVVWTGSSPSQVKQQLAQKGPQATVKLKIPLRFVNASVTPAKPFKPLSLLIKPLPTDKPFVHQVLDFYQENKAYEDLFSKKGESMLCGPASLANALVYLKHYRNPKFEKIAAKHADTIKKNGDYIPLLFKICGTDPELGTTTAQLGFGAKALVAEGGYGVAEINEQGAWAGDKNLVKTVTPQALKELCLKPDKAVVLLFGWYGVEKDENNKLVFQRNGGHFVFLAGYDGLNPEVFYVSNPLVDYSPLYPLRYSRVTLKKLAGNIEAPEHMEWYTDDLVGGNFAILENILVVLPKLTFSAPKVAR